MKARIYKKLARNGIPRRSKKSWNRTFARRARRWRRSARDPGYYAGNGVFPLLEASRCLRSESLARTGKFMSKASAMAAARGAGEI